ncbi:peptide-methionine (S)-S-oxide reductase MsrA [Pannonibacter tanglangensis]|uniref:Peptide methionine sulfoxide reductase MsrA n=1 Tax=Pannonibacter tanglangensis TaxID=2750084 RepID=A0ABW9ZQ85_9HYPH|nr:peptide-methionine (S)-S-oxide reductase MsrA [Pannonibacter sp. XCT-34]NBN66052.1 peptide-methionine (S)-S-oxide reductase MsrA [Pannonibacter sp. XCT-34]
MARAAALALAFLVAAPAPASAETALFAGGCFWCVEADMDKVPGVTATISGYAGGKSEQPTYRTYEDGGHREVVQVTFDPAKVSYAQLVAIFLRTVDVTDAGGQFCDRGFGYSTAIHALTPAQEKAAKAEIARAERLLGRSIVTPVEGAARFWPAEDYHQDYYLGENRTLTRFGYVRQSEAYKGYRGACGRDVQVRRVWGEEAFKGLEKPAS